MQWVNYDSEKGGQGLLPDTVHCSALGRVMVMWFNDWVCSTGDYAYQQSFYLPNNRIAVGYHMGRIIQQDDNTKDAGRLYINDASHSVFAEFTENKYGKNLSGSIVLLTSWDND